MAAQASAEQAAKVPAEVTAARLRPVNHSRGARSRTVGWSAAPMPISSPDALSPRATKQPTRTSSTGMMLVWPR